jgi:CheY-like chemotaxis protein
VLVVDDNTDTARGLARLLRLLGHDVRLAHSGPEGLEAARDFRPGAVLLDIGLPGMDGYEVARRLRQGECPEVLIIAITGYGQDEDRQRSRAAGIDHHLVKPVDHDALLAVLGGEAPRSPVGP